MSDNKPTSAKTAADSAVEFAREEILGARQWRRSKLASITGIGSILDAARSAKARGGESVDRVQGLATAAFAPDTSGRPIPDTIQDPRERFLMSMQRNGKTSADVASSVATTYRQFWLYVALMLATVILAFVTFPKLAELRGAMDVLFGLVFRLSPLMLLGAMALRAGWTNWTFRRYRLEGLGPYVRSGSSVLPHREVQRRRAAPPARAGGTALRVGVLIAIGLGTFVAATHLGTVAALAQDVVAQGSQNANRVFVDPSRQDLFIRLLSYVIPDAGPIPSNPDAGNAASYKLIRDGLSVFAATLLFIGMLMSGFQIINGIVASAKEGTAIGRAYHEVWAPVRTVIGYGMLVPIANGLCGAQILCLYLIAWGGNLANLIWTPYVEGSAITMTSTNQSDLAKTALQSVGSTIANGIMQSVMEKELCRATLSTMRVRGAVWGTNEAAPDSSPAFSAPSMAASYTVNLFDSKTTYTANYGSICGKLEIDVPLQNRNPTRTEVVAQPGSTSTTTVALSSGYEDNRAYVLGMARLKAVQDMKTALVPIAEQAARTYQTGTDAVKVFSPDGDLDPGQFRQIRDDYIANLVSNVASTLDPSQIAGSNSLMEEMKKDAIASGWAKAGTYYLTLTRVQSNLYSGLYGGIRSSTLDLQSASAVSQSLSEYLFYRDRAPGIIPQFRSYWVRNIDTITNDASAKLTKAGSNSVFDSISDFFLWFGSLFSHYNVNPLNPMGSMIEYGDFLMRLGFGAFLGAMALTKAGTILGAVGGTAAGGVVGGVAGAVLGSVASDALNVLSTPLSLVAGAIVMAGAVHAYVIPLMPYMITMFFVGSMLLLTVESLVAAPLWAFFHIRLDGQEFIDQVQKPGYMIAFNLLLRPVLMIFGLILSMLVFGAMSWFVSITFVPAANGLAASTTVGPIGACVLVVMLGYLNFNLASKAFHLINEIPDRVTRWFGQAGERLGEDNDTNQLRGAVVGAVVGKGDAVMSNTMLGRMGAAGRQQGKLLGAASRGGQPPSGSPDPSDQKAEAPSRSANTKAGSGKADVVT